MKKTRFALHGMAAAIALMTSAASARSTKPKSRGLYIGDGNEEVGGGGGDPASVVSATNVDGDANAEVQDANIGALTDATDPVSGAVNTETAESTVQVAGAVNSEEASSAAPGGNPEGSVEAGDKVADAVVEGDGTNSAGAVLEEVASAVVTEGAEAATAVKTDGDASAEGGGTSEGSDPAVGTLIRNSEYCYKKG